ncbi:PQ loop repeat-domain-containing protein [Gloeopeniophorella convolvens]|nr:PQ loop repeat-domain-containing protein [Gloeopeniophorella convolvens]
MSLFSDCTGYLSILLWLGAQFPQVLENARRQSVEGLALPFLANWLAGDMTNLIGCLLTHQLPFQTWLATYFCFVDITLLTQYFYYRKTATPTVSVFNHPRSRAGSVAHRASLERAPSHYRTLSAAAANVATAAAVLASQRNEPPSSAYPHTRWPRQSLDGLLDNDPYHRSGEDDEVDEDALTMLADSIHSERSGRRKHVSWSKERHPSSGNSRAAGRQGIVVSPIPTSLQITASTDDFDPLARGRSLQRASLQEEDQDWHRDHEESQRRRSSRASKRGATMVFMSAWALFGVGVLNMRAHGVDVPGSIQLGRVLSPSAPAVAGVVLPSPSAGGAPPPPVALAFDEPHHDYIFKHDEPTDGPSLERIIGRISAWTCTTLYLTSRLPQIWKNYVRKSVEGLSMFLFVFAFLGNFFYVLSLLSSPSMQGTPAESSAFLKESMPFLLGSGGTLMFDVLIVTQSFIYRPHPSMRGRRTSVHDAEEEGLMHADDVEDPNTPRRRLPTTVEAVDSRN